VLCDSTNESDDCGEEENIYAAETPIAATSANLTITTKVLGSTETISCGYSALGGKTVASIDTAELWGSLSSFSFSECADTLFESACTIEATGLSYEVAFSATGGGPGDGDAQIWNESSAPKLKVTCGSFKCTYEAAETTELEGTEGSVKAVEASLQGGSTGTLEMEGAELKVPSSEGILCTSGTVATINAEYAISEPSPVYVAFVPIKVTINPEPIELTVNNTTKVTVTNDSPKAVVTVSKLALDTGSNNTLDKKTCVAPTNVLDPTDQNKKSCEFTLKCNKADKEDFTVEYVTSWKTQIQRYVKTECK
jgi:hypothetical protein